jgi:hypothetical protein
MADLYDKILLPKKPPCRRKLNVVDLFCGCGGLSVGFEMDNGRVLAGFDHDRAALATYAEYFPKAIARQLDLASPTVGSDIKAVLGGNHQVGKPKISGCFTRLRMIQAPPQSVVVVARGEPHQGAPHGRLAKYLVSEVLQLHMNSLKPQPMIPDPLGRTLEKQLRDLQDFHELISLGEGMTLETSTFIFRDNRASPRESNAKVYHFAWTGMRKHSTVRKGSGTSSTATSQSSMS